MTRDISALIQGLEAERSRALIDEDYDSLGAMLSTDLVHIHASGHVENKADYLNTIRTKLRFLKISSRFSVRAYDGFAVANGELEQTLLVRESEQTLEMRTMVMQVWRQVSDRWLLNSFQATPLK